jgi:hypothetical protein
MSKYSQVIDVDFLGVWDTVGALGLPFGDLPILGKGDMQFLNTGIRVSNKFAFHALAIDEHRKAFAPTLAANFGLAKHLEHDLRYDRADEFMEVVLGHWDTWEDDAIVFDRESGTFSDPGKVHRLDHKGTFFSSRGPFTVPRSPQGHPVIIQAGQSGRGWGELLFVIHPQFDMPRTATWCRRPSPVCGHGRRQA